MGVTEGISDMADLNCAGDTGTVKETESARRRNERKMNRRRTKFISLVERDIGLVVTQIPSEWLIVWGFGLANGTTKREVQSKFGNPKEIRYFKDKAYCFMKYGSIQEAKTVKEMFEELFWELSLRESNPVKKFIGYANDEPPLEDLRLIESFMDEKIPAGLRIINDYVSREEEEMILSRIGPHNYDGSEPESKDMAAETITKTLKHRWVRHFGYEFRYGSNDIDFDNPLSEPVPDYLDKMTDGGVFDKPPEQLTVNHYQSGQGIPPHVDTHSCFEGPIVSLSLGSEVVMNFRRGDKLFSKILPARSLLVMDGESRHGWTHGISNRTFDIVPSPTCEGIDILHRSIRLSLTFRRLRQSRICHCSFPEMCDSQKGKICEENAANLEEKLVHTVYENIAPHFHETRHTPWPKVKNFIESLQEGAVVLDVGCGNGKYFHVNANSIQIGTDMSSGLLQICKERNCEVLRANALQLPFKNDSVHAVICIAVLHHISTKERRLAAISEMIRVLTVEGQALIYVWSKDQHHQDEESVYASKQSANISKSLVDPCVAKTTDFSFIPIHDRQADFSQNDVLVPWVNVKDEISPVHHRYYHVFDKGELESLLEELNPVPKLLDSYYDQGNWVVKIMKDKCS